MTALRVRGNGLDIAVSMAGLNRTEAGSDPAIDDGVPIVFIHGFSHDRHVWEDVLCGLPEALAPLTLDLRGHGESDWALAGSYRPEDYASDLAPVLDALSVERAIVVGHSLGGNVATLFAAAQPDRVSALVLVDTGPALSGDAWQAVSGDVASAMGCFDDIASYRRLLSLAYPFGRGEALDRLARTGLVQRLDGRFEPKLDPLIVERTGTDDDWVETESALWAALGKLQCPTLVVRGEQSAMLSEAVARQMVENVLAHGTAASVERAGHAIAVDNAIGLSEAIATFVDEQVLTR